MYCYNEQHYWQFTAHDSYSVSTWMLLNVKAILAKKIVIIRLIMKIAKKLWVEGCALSAAAFRDGAVIFGLLTE